MIVIRGHEQKGRRPALVVSPRCYNKKTNLALMCPVTSRKRGYSFEVGLDEEGIEGVVLADHVRSLDWNARKVDFIESSSEKVIKQVKEKLALLINF